MQEDNGKIILTAEDGSEDAFFVMEKAEIAGQSYLLVTDTMDETEEEAMALILKERVEKQVDGEDTIFYDVLEDDDELVIISKYFEELLDDDVDLELE